MSKSSFVADDHTQGTTDDNWANPALLSEVESEMQSRSDQELAEQRDRLLRSLERFKQLISLDSPDILLVKEALLISQASSRYAALKLATG